ncbi:MAG: hypothetical protein K0U68_09560, partial [Gammaproteobacteria bacterium]|nr:hypothetical protein [Gammaproteobacteria bacterium]
MEQNLHHRRHHAPVNRADLLWCFNSLSENQHTGMAKLLGFEELPEVKQQPEPAHTHTEKEPDFQPYQPQESKSSPAAKQQGSAYYRVKDRRINEPSKTTADTTDQQLTPPDWFSEARPTYLQET